MKLTTAKRKKVKLKVGFSGASGFGKTVSALLMAYGITKDWSKIAVIDSENSSASLYSNHTLPNGFIIGEFQVIDLEPPFSPERYIEAIKMCENAGIEVVIVDSITHEWDGIGGCLDIYEKLGGRYQDWAKVTPRHKKFINTILQAHCHVFTTVRRKQDYDMIKNDKGKMQVQKVGTKEITREGFEYEITLNFEFNNSSHMVTASKDRTSLFADSDPFIITEETGEKLINWANSGVDEKQYLIDSIQAAQNRDEGITIWGNNPKYHTDKDVLEVFKDFGKKFPKKEEEKK